MDFANACPQKRDATFCPDGEELVVTSLLCPIKPLCKNEFTQLKSKGTRFFGTSIRMHYICTHFQEYKIGVTAFKKGGNAVLRNYFRRMVKEIFRKLRPSLPPGLYLQVLPQVPLKDLSYRTILIDFQKFLLGIPTLNRAVRLEVGSDKQL